MSEPTNVFLEAVARQFKVLAEPQRLRLLYLLKSGERSVGELVTESGLSQPNVSKHLAMLKTQGLVERRREGSNAYFGIAAPFVFRLCDIVCDEMRRELDRRSVLLASVDTRSRHS